jgi:transcriptional regulator with XRE-family HTH domain
VVPAVECGQPLGVEDLRARFGRRVRELRLASGLSQEELAHRAGLHYTYVGGIERGERNLGLMNVERVAAGLGISLAELFSVFRTRPPRQ